MDHVKTIIIVGGGFAGTTLARALDGRLPLGYESVLISEESYTTFNPMLPEAVGASVFPEQAVAPIRQMVSRTRFVMGRVIAVDPAGRTLTAATLAGERTMPYEHLVLAFGNRARLDLIPGLVDHALPLKTIGDCALVVNARDGKFAPPTAQFAVREARQLAANLAAVLDGAPTRAFAYKAHGSMASIGHMKGVADFFGIPLSGLPAWLLWRAYYLSQMPTFGRKLRIFVEWTWGMFFPTDITYLRFTRSHDVDDGRQPAPPGITSSAVRAVEAAKVGVAA